MDWRGIEWAVPVFEMVMIALPIYGSITLYRRTKRGALRKSRALLRYGTLVIAPIILYILFFSALVGFEELTRISVVPEGLARISPLLLGLGMMICIVSTIAFGVALMFIKNQPAAPPDTRAERTP